MAGIKNTSAICTLIHHNIPFWHGEYQVTFAYLTNGVRTRETDAKWLGHQAYKENSGSGVYGGEGENVSHILTSVATKIAQINETFDISELKSLEYELSFVSDEFRHYVNLFEAYKVADPNSSSTIEELGSLPEGEKLSAIRYERRKTPLGKIAVDLSEGGGLGSYFGICDALFPHKNKSELDQLILNIAKNTLADEMTHMSYRYLTAYNMSYSDTEWCDLDSMLQEICWHKLLERNAQFSSPFSESELRNLTTHFEMAYQFTEKHLGFLLRRLNIDLKQLQLSNL
jgi:hypothetical protein